jgi:hypothetical protein
VEVKKEEGKSRVVVRSRGEGVKNVKVGKLKVGERIEGENIVTVGNVEVRVGEQGRENKVRKVEEGVGGAAGGIVVKGSKADVKVGEVTKEVGDGAILVQQVVKKKETVPVVPGGSKDQNDGSNIKFIPAFKSRDEDHLWANSGMVASIGAGKSSLAIKQKVEDAGFLKVVVTPMGGDRVFLHCTNGEDVWIVFNEAIDFFGMLFSNIHKWSESDVRYDMGHGCVCMVSSCMCGALISLRCVFQVTTDFSKQTNAQSIRQG